MAPVEPIAIDQTLFQNRTDWPPSRCVKPYYNFDHGMFYQHLTMHCSYQFLLMSYIFTLILTLAHLFYAYFTHGPNKSASAQYDNTQGNLAHPRGMYYIKERKGSRIHPCCGAAVRAQLAYISSSEKCCKCVIIHNNYISENLCILYVLIIYLQCVRLLYTYNLNS